MIFRFYSNACGVFIGNKGTSILCDPWIENGVFDGSWYHFPKLKTKKSLEINADAIYLSHIHPDHFDERFFNYDKNIPIILLDHGPNFLIKKLTSLGFKNLITCKNYETIKFKEFNLTLFAPFIKNHFHSVDVGNLIDSAILLESGGFSAINFNDNTPTPEACNSIKEKFGIPTMALLGYNSAGPYPSCFDNLNEEEKLKERKRIIDRNYNYTASLIKALGPVYVLPFAGEYILGGSNVNKNKYLASTTWEECAKAMESRDIGDSKVILMRETDEFHLSSSFTNRAYVPINCSELNQYLHEISSDQYPYQKLEFPERSNLISDISQAAKLLIQRMKNYNLKTSFSVYLFFSNQYLRILPDFSDVDSPSNDERVLIAKIDERLLRLILDRKSHWNNADIGCHIDYFRHPNIYEPDLHLALQFFHL
jgi:UDP-MurNAc hydroxylase